VTRKSILPPLLFHKWFFVSFYKNGKKLIYENDLINHGISASLPIDSCPSTRSQGYTNAGDLRSQAAKHASQEHGTRFYLWADKAYHPSLLRAENERLSLIYQ